VSDDGLEMTFALNHLGYYTLTCLLADVLIKSAPARIINVASESHRGAEIDFDDLQMERGYGPLKAYGRSKLANVLFNYELARRLQPSGVTANALHPGFLRTEIAANNGLIGRVLRKLMNLWARPVEEGVEAVLTLATRPNLGDVSGQYFIGSHPARSSEISYDESAARRLWQASESLSGVRLYLSQAPKTY
jgi:NAD(P)-dependent dehydrogenase (short-subunit alcohol dehydrogenase family)